MKTDIWMPLYVADYLADTGRLTTEQHGAYLLIIMDYWRNGAPPDDDAVLAQIARMTPDAWRNARSILQAFFEQCSGMWVHKRVEQELAAAAVNREVAQLRAKTAAEARWAKVKQSADARSNASSNARSNAQALLEECPSPSPSSSPSSSSPSAPSPAPKRGADTERNSAIWEAYADAYAARYGVAPVRNARTNGQVAQFAKRVPAEDAVALAAWFVGHNDQFYLKTGHQLAQLLKDAEKLRTEWATGRRMTSTQARQLDRAGSMMDIVAKIKAERGEV